MSALEQRFREDRAMRDMAKRNLDADLANTRAALSGTGLINRVTGRVSEGARDAYQSARAQANEKPGIAAAIAGALVLLVAGKPLLNLLLRSDDDEEVEDHDRTARRNRCDHRHDRRHRGKRRSRRRSD